MTQTGTTSPEVEITEVCQDCDLVVDWSAIETWSDGAPVDPDKTEIVLFCFYRMTVEEFEVAWGASEICSTGAQAIPWEVEDRSITIPAMATPGTPGVGVVGLWVVSGDGHFSQIQFIVGAPEGTNRVIFE